MDTCVLCRYPLDPAARAALLQKSKPKEWLVCPGCAALAPVPARPPGIPPPEPGERRLFTVPPEEKSGLVVTVNRRLNRAQILGWDQHFVRRVIWTGTPKQFLFIWVEEPLTPELFK